MELSLSDFEKRTGLQPDKFPWLAQADRVVRLAKVKTITAVLPMSFEYLQALLNNVSYGCPEIKGYAYRGCPIELAKIDVERLQMTQNFVQQDKLEFFETLFSSHFPSRFPCFDPSTCGPIIVTGKSADGTNIMSHYVPPIIEEHSSELLLLEGMHRCFTSYKRRVAQYIILIRDVQAPFPWIAKPWDSVAIVNEKPPEAERKFGGDPSNFRHFIPVGIDT